MAPVHRADYMNGSVFHETEPGVGERTAPLKQTDVDSNPDGLSKDVALQDCSYLNKTARMMLMTSWHCEVLGGRPEVSSKVSDSGLGLSAD